jgi:D-threo-aldose 1-dehydrogenase
MRRQNLAQTGLEASRLGFGCVQLTAHRNRRDAVAILEHAFSQGITHFDIARAYGFGRAESILGEFLRGKRSEVTVATKFGLQPPSGLAGNGKIIDAAKTILRPFPGLLRRAKARGAAMGRSGLFTPDAAIQSLETSLRELKTDYVDLFLLHEATLVEAGSQVLIEALDRQVKAGKVRCLGIASDFEKLSGDRSQLPLSYQVLQFNDNVATRSMLHPGNSKRHDFITHSIFKPAKTLTDEITRHAQQAREFSLRMNLDLSDPKVINSILVHYALRSNSQGVVLFSSTNPLHISANVRELDVQDYDESQWLQFLELANILSAQPEASRVGGGRNLSGP